MLDDKGQNSNIDLDLFISNIQEKFNISKDEIAKLSDVSKITIPLTIFRKDLGMLESIVLYLKDDKGLGFKTIAKLLKREYQTIWSSYNKAKKKTNDKK